MQNIKIRGGKPSQQERNRIRKEKETTDLPTEEAKTFKEAEAMRRAGGEAQCALGNRAEAPIARRSVRR